MHWLLHSKQGWSGVIIILHLPTAQYSTTTNKSYTKQELECMKQLNQWHKKMANWSVLTSNVYRLATGEADRNNKLMSTS